MANAETQFMDDILVKSRRKLLTLGATSLAGMLLGGAKEAEAATASYTDADIFNFALNLEYLEANFYYAAAFGTTIDVANAASTAAKAPQIALTGSVGMGGQVTGAAARFLSSRSRSRRMRSRLRLRKASTSLRC